MNFNLAILPYDDQSSSAMFQCLPKTENVSRTVPSFKFSLPSWNITLQTNKLLTFEMNAFHLLTFTAHAERVYKFKFQICIDPCHGKSIYVSSNPMSAFKISNWPLLSWKNGCTLHAHCHVEQMMLLACDLEMYPFMVWPALNDGCMMRAWVQWKLKQKRPWALLAPEGGCRRIKRGRRGWRLDGYAPW